MWQIVYRKPIRCGLWSSWFVAGFKPFADKETAKGECRFCHFANVGLEFGIQHLLEKERHWSVEGF